MVLRLPDSWSNWNLKCWFLRRGGNRSTRRKTSRSKGENQQQTQPTYGVEAGICTRTTMVGSASALTTAPSLAPPGNKSTFFFILGTVILEYLPFPLLPWPSKNQGLLRRLKSSGRTAHSQKHLTAITCANWGSNRV